MTLHISQLVVRLQELQEANGDLEVRYVDWDYIKSRELENHTSIKLVKSADSHEAMGCDDLHDDCYPYILIGNY